VITVSSASAQPSPSCQNAGFNVEVSQSTQWGNHQGIHADVWLGNGNNDCSRVSSLVVVSGQPNGFVEFGWLLGYSTCNGNYYSSPRYFVWWRPNNGPDDCEILTNGPAGTYVTMALRDENQDTNWAALKGGVGVFSLDVNFDRGIGATNGERDCTCDSAYAHFKSLHWQVSGGSTWLDWTSPTLYCDTDPGFRWHNLSATEHEIDHDSGTYTSC
jgi:hypothetical protein